MRDLIYIEKYRPSDFEDLVLNDKVKLINYLENPKMVPSFIFYSNRPGTGKTSTAKLIIDILKCDSLNINASDDRGIDSIREKVKLFSQSLSSNEDSKRCVFMDEADGLTRQAQDSLRNLMEEYSENCFFIFTANDLSKIIDPIRSRCEIINFEKPDKNDIMMRLRFICKEENLPINNLQDLIETYYPDIRKMIGKLQEAKISDEPWEKDLDQFEEFYALMKAKNIRGISDKVYSGDFDVMAFNKWFFEKLFKESDSFKNITDIALCVADTEKYWNLGASIEIIFLSNILKILKLI